MGRRSRLPQFGRRASSEWLRKNGLMDARPAQERSDEPLEGGAIDACANVALGGGTLVRLDAEGASRTEDGDHPRFEPKRRGPLTAEIDGFNLQAAVRIEAADDEGLERLARYCARSAFALERLSVLPEGISG